MAKTMNIVNTMNISRSKTADPPLAFQTERLHTLLDEINQCCQDRVLFESQKFDLPQAELKCMMLFPGERYLTAKGIARKMDVARSRVTLLIDGLLRKDLVQRIDDPKDGRVKLISLTAEGRRKTREIEGFFREAHERILLQMTPSERKTVLSSLEFLRASMEIVKAQLK